MKKNSLTLALLLYPIGESQGRSLSLEQVHTLLPGLTSDGRRSLLYHLEKETILFSERVLGVLQYSLTEHGQRQLMELFPALDSKWDTFTGAWQCMVFQQAPKSDQQFRYLRAQLVKEHAVQLSRGVYCTPGVFSSNVTEMCRTLYQGAVSIFSVASWDFGFERSTITRNFSLADLATSYSGISSELDSLLVGSAESRSMNDQDKKQFFSVFDRFRDLLHEDVGITSFYYPQAPSGQQLLAKVQQCSEAL